MNESTEMDDLAFVACKLIRFVFETTKAVENSKYHKFHENFKQFLTIIDTTKSKFKFQLINYLNSMLTCKPLTDTFQDDSDLNDFVSSKIYSILNELFKSKQEIQLAFYLLKHFLDLFQFEYIYMKDRKFFYFLIHLMCIQTALSLEEKSNGKDADLALMSIYYQLLEDVIIILSTASPFDTVDDDNSEEDEYDDDEDEEEEEKIKHVDYIKLKQ